MCEEQDKGLPCPSCGYNYLTMSKWVGFEQEAEWECVHCGEVFVYPTTREYIAYYVPLKVRSNNENKR